LTRINARSDGWFVSAGTFRALRELPVCDLKDLLQGDGIMAVNARGSRSGRWRLSRAFLLGAVLGGALGALWGWLDYGAFEIGHFSNYILGCLFLGGFAFLAAAALRNWARRNPL
jgi:hypothetical protein